MARLRATARHVAAAMLVALVLVAPAAGVPSVSRSLLLKGTVVTMDDSHRVLADGNVLVSDGIVIAVWSGATPPGIDTRGARTVSAGPRGLIFPGLIDLHDHPPFDVLPMWPRPPLIGNPLSAARPVASPTTSGTNGRSLLHRKRPASWRILARSASRTHST